MGEALTHTGPILIGFLKSSGLENISQTQNFEENHKFMPKQYLIMDSSIHNHLFPHHQLFHFQGEHVVQHHAHFGNIVHETHVFTKI